MPDQTPSNPEPPSEPGRPAESQPPADPQQAGYPQHPSSPQQPPPGPQPPVYPTQPAAYYPAPPPHQAPPGQYPAPNPYQAPQPHQPPPGPMQAYPQQYPPIQAMPPNTGIWREGNLLVMHKYAQLPDVCVKSNKPAEGRRLRRSMYWHHPAIYLVILAGLLIYVILAVVLQKSATVYVGLSPEWFAIRRRRMLIAWGLVLLSVVLFIGGVAGVGENEALGWLILIAVALFFGAAVYGALAARMVGPARITDEYVWLKGVHPDYLAQLSPWPYGHL